MRKFLIFLCLQCCALTVLLAADPFTLDQSTVIAGDPLFMVGRIDMNIVDKSAPSFGFQAEIDDLELSVSAPMIIADDKPKPDQTVSVAIILWYDLSSRKMITQLNPGEHKLVLTHRGVTLYSGIFKVRLPDATEAVDLLPTGNLQDVFKSIHNPWSPNGNITKFVGALAGAIPKEQAVMASQLFIAFDLLASTKPTDLAEAKRIRSDMVDHLKINRDSYQRLSSNTRLAYWSYLTKVNYAHLLALSGEMDEAVRQLNGIAEKNMPYLSAKAKKMTSEIARKANGK